MQVRLKVLKGSKAGKSIKLPMPRCLVGRSDECHLQSRIDAISQKHCLITTTESEIVVCDLKSLNGTYVNGKRVSEETVLHAGDQLQIGPLVFEVVIESAKGKRQMVQSFVEVSAGTAGGSANLSTLIVESSKRQKMSEGSLAVSAEPIVEELLLAGDREDPRLPIGQTVVIARGALEGATGTIVKRSSGDHYLVSLEMQNGQIWMRLPGHLLRAT